MDITSSTLRGCVTSLETSSQLLENSLSQLDSLMPNLERLPQVLKQNKIFTLIPEFEISQAKGTIQNEITPKFDKLMKIIHGRVSKQERKLDGLKMKIQLNSVRTANLERDQLDAQGSNNEDSETIEGSEEELQTLKILRRKKEALRSKLSMLELQNRKNRLSTGFN